MSVQGTRLFRPCGEIGEIVYESALNYTGGDWSNYLRVPDHKGPYEAQPLAPGFKSPSFRVVRFENVCLNGYRTFLKNGDCFFNDCTILDGYDTNIIYRKFKNGLTENTCGLIGDGGIIIPECRDRIHIAEPVLCMCSDEPANYGSWIYRFLPKLIKYKIEPIFVYCNKGWIRSLIKMFWGKIRIIEHDINKNYYFKEAYIPSLRNVGIYFDDETLEYYRELAKRVKGRSIIRKLYLSRVGQKNVRPILNELEFISNIERHGFVAVEPERLSIQEQICVIRDADEIIVPGGSGLFNLVFAANAQRIVDVEPSMTWVHGHRSLMTSCRLQHSVVYGGKDDESEVHSPWTINIPSVLSIL